MIFSNLRGREIRISVFDRVLLKNKNANLFVKGLCPEDTNLTFYNMFKPFGEIFSSRLSQDSQHKCKGYGFVQYKYETESLKAIKEMHGKERLGKILTVEQYKIKNPFTQAYKNLYVKNLPNSITTKTDLEKLFLPFGAISSSAIFMKEFQGKTSYFGFVCFKESQDATKAFQTLNNKEIDNVKIYVNRAMTKEQRAREWTKKKIETKFIARKTTLHIKTANGEPLNEELVKSELMKYGEIKQISIRMLLNGEKLPVGFVVFANEMAMNKAISEYPQGKALVINKLEGKEERAERIRKMRTFQRYEYSANLNNALPYMVTAQMALPLASPMQMPPMHNMSPMRMRGSPNQSRYNNRRSRGRAYRGISYRKMQNDYEIPLYPNAKQQIKPEEKIVKLGPQEEMEQFGEQLYDKVEKLTNEYFYCILYFCIDKLHQKLQECY